MSDYERYGDYNEIEEDAPKSNNPVMLILKILTAVICIGVVGFLAFRLFIFNSYPDSVKGLYVNDELAAHYAEVGDEIRIKTQSLRYPYDNEDEGNFFCSNLIVIPEINQLQITARFNVSLMDSIKEKYGVELNPDAENLFTFKLSVIPLSVEGSAPISTGTLSVSESDKLMMYRYYKLVFDDVDFSIEGEEEIWIRLEIFINGVEMENPYMILVYEDTEEAKFENYKL